MVSCNYILAWDCPSFEEADILLCLIAIQSAVLCPAYRDMEVEDAIELGRLSIYLATFRDAVSGGTVSGMSSFPSIFSSALVCILHAKTMQELILDGGCSVSCHCEWLEEG